MAEKDRVAFLEDCLKRIDEIVHSETDHFVIMQKVGRIVLGEAGIVSEACFGSVFPKPIEEKSNMEVA